MEKIIGWEEDLPLAASESGIGMESFNPEMSDDDDCRTSPYFKPVNIITEKGIHFATIYACHCRDSSTTSQQLAIWFGSLKETDQVNLTILSLLQELPLAMIINLMSAITSTKAKLNIHLDHVVTDTLAYFYLIPEKITVGTEGALFIPSYVAHRVEDSSGPARAVQDFFKWIVAEAVKKNLLTEEEADCLDRGSHVALTEARLQSFNQ